MFNKYTGEFMRESLDKIAVLAIFGEDTSDPIISLTDYLKKWEFKYQDEVNSVNGGEPGIVFEKSVPTILAKTKPDSDLW